jgi:hypothetical protein
MPVKREFLKTKQLKQHFAKAESISIDQLYKFYNTGKNIIPKSTLRWRIYKLLNAGVLMRIGRGKYKFGTEAIYQPDTTKSVKAIYEKIKKNFPYANICGWHTNYLNEFTIHQPGRHSIIIEAEKDTTESIFNFIKEQYKEAFLNPTKDVYHRYISGKKESIVVLNLISEAPTQAIDDIIVPTIEKILVDIFTDNSIFSTFQGKEMQNIFINVLQKYTVNMSTLNRYAYRRGKKEELEQYIKKLTFRQ